jgi:flavin reductase (DIM6/NTAB) family NADH-FMN oxidoreductase RutF
MKKISVPVSNHFCPQTLFLFGTYKEDGTANYGLFCWVSYCWDGELRLMVCIGGDKLTRDRIRDTKVFSASLVTEAMLAKADYLGSNSGYEVDKSAVFDSVRGDVLNVPIPQVCPWSYELEVVRSFPLEEGNEIYVCKIRNILADERLADDSVSVEERMRLVSPALTTVQTYFSLSPSPTGVWGQWKESVPL